MTDIKRLAELEAEAERNKTKAEATWRHAWWETTLALGQITEKPELSEAQALVAEVTGTGLKWIQDRTRTGRKLDPAHPVVRTLPPRITMEAARRGVEITDTLIDDMIAAEQNGVSLREFSASLGGKAWADTPTGASEQTIEAIIEAQPDVVAKVLGSRPESLVAGLSQEDRLDLSRALDRQIALDHPVTGPSDPTGVIDEIERNKTASERIVRPIIEAGQLMHRAEEQWDRYWADASAGDKRMVARALQENLVICERLRMDVVLDDTEEAEEAHR